MAQNNKELSAKIAEKNGVETKVSFQARFDRWFETNRTKILQLASNKEEAMRKIAICLGSINRNPKLLECEPGTLFQCISQSLSLDLLPSPHNECAYIHRWNSKTGRNEANFEVQYQGYVKHILNAGNKQMICRVVMEGDYFEYNEITHPPKFIPAVVLGNEPGAVLFAYAAVLTPDACWQVEVMSEKDILGIKSMSKAKDADYSPWNSKIDTVKFEMYKKTVAKRIRKYIRQSEKLLELEEADNITSGFIEAPRQILPLSLAGKALPSVSQAAIAHEEREEVDMSTKKRKVKEQTDEIQPEEGEQRETETEARETLLS